jgi:hypothetical protein
LDVCACCTAAATTSSPLHPRRLSAVSGQNVSISPDRQTHVARAVVDKQIALCRQRSDLIGLRQNLDRPAAIFEIQLSVSGVNHQLTS